MAGKVIAVCTNIQEFDIGPAAWNNNAVWQKYPGSGWLQYLEKYAKQVGIETMSGLDALYRIKRGALDRDDVLIVQEEENDVALRLEMAGAKRSVLYCLESPLFTPFFYDYLPTYKEGPNSFPFQILFGELGNVKAYFPSFDAEKDLEDPIPWEDRKKMACMVMSNKHYNQINAGRLGISETWDYAIAHQLHDLRFHVIEYFKNQKRVMDLYGRGWDPGIAKEIPPGKKIDVLREYKYCFCIENVEMPGYVTEKIIESYVAGCVPVYVGAPDFGRYADSLAAIPGKNLELSQILECMNECSDSTALFRLGQDFIKGSAGYKFSYQSFAKTVLDCVLKTIHSR